MPQLKNQKAPHQNEQNSVIVLRATGCMKLEQISE